MNFTTKLQLIANALHMPLYYDGKTINGAMKGKLTTPIGLTIPVNLVVTDYFMKDEFGVLCDVIEDLGLLVALFPKSGALTLYLLDKSKIFSAPQLLISHRMGLRDAVQAIRPAVAAVFDFRGTRWISFSL